MGAAEGRARLRGQVPRHAGPSGFVTLQTFLRWRPDKPPRDCRYDQLEVTTAFELEKVFGAVPVYFTMTRCQSQPSIPRALIAFTHTSSPARALDNVARGVVTRVSLGCPSPRWRTT